MDRRFSDGKLFKILKELPGWWQVAATILVAAYTYGVMNTTVMANCEMDNKQQVSIESLTVKVAKLEQAVIELSAMREDIRDIRNIVVRNGRRHE